MNRVARGLLMIMVGIGAASPVLCAAQHEAKSVSFAPDGKAIVSERGPAGVTDGSAVSSYSIHANGTLAAVSQSVPTFGAANCWNAVTPNGKYVYVSNAGSSTISGFAISSTGALTPIGSTVVGSNPAGGTNLDIAVSADGLKLYTFNSGSGNIVSLQFIQMEPSPAWRGWRICQVRRLQWNSSSLIRRPVGCVSLRSSPGRVAVG